MRTWRLLVWTGKKYAEANCGDFKFEASGPQDALKKSGLDIKEYTVRYSRIGYNYFTGRIYVSAPETVAAGKHQPADFILEVVA